MFCAPQRCIRLIQNYYAYGVIIMLHHVEPDLVGLIFYIYEIHINRNKDLNKIRRVEVSIIQIKFNNDAFNVINIYIPSNKNYQHISLRKLSELSTQISHCATYTGDLNSHLMLLEYSHSDNLGKMFEK